MNTHAEVRTRAAVKWLLARHPDAFIEERSLRYDRSTRTHYETVEYTIRLTLNGSYVGSLIEKSNRECLLEDHPTLLGETFFSYNARAAVIVLEVERVPRDEVISLDEALTRMERYVIFDGDHYYHMLFDMEQDAWTEAHDEIVNMLTEALDEDRPPYTEPNAQAIYDAWLSSDGFRDYDAFTSNEHDSVYVDVDAVVDAVLYDLRNDDLNEPPYITAPWTGLDTPDAARKRISEWNRLNVAHAFPGVAGGGHCVTQENAR